LCASSASAIGVTGTSQIAHGWGVIARLVGAHRADGVARDDATLVDTICNDGVWGLTDAGVAFDVVDSTELSGVVKIGAHSDAVRGVAAGLGLRVAQTSGFV
jgi:hypothetical protein